MYEATKEMIRASYAKEGFTYVPPRPRTPVPVHTPEKHDWDFFYRSLQAPPEIRPSTSRTSTTSLDLSSQRSNGTPMMPSSTAQLPQPFILLGHHPQPQSRSTPRTSSPVSKPMKPGTHSSHMVGQRSTISQPMPS